MMCRHHNIEERSPPSFGAGGVIVELRKRDARIAEANAILQTCVHYGFCTNTCPTYVLTRDRE
jgi:heterodisulfide reductase subunit C